MGSNRQRAGQAIVCVAVLGAGLACGVQDAATTGPASSTEGMAAAGTAAGSGQATEGGVPTGGARTGGGSADGSSGGVSGSDGGGVPATTGVDPVSACDPATAAFDLQASVSFDFAARSCAVTLDEGSVPRLTLEVRDSGLLDIRAEGISMASASSGTYVNDANIVGVMPDVPITIEASATMDDSPVTIELEVSGLGPVLVADALFRG